MGWIQHLLSCLRGVGEEAQEEVSHDGESGDQKQLESASMKSEEELMELPPEIAEISESELPKDHMSLWPTCSS